MPLINWEPRFSVGSLVLDEQHKTLIALINQLHAAMLKGAPAGEMRQVFSELVAYTESHFKAEEGLMQRGGYPRLEAHCAEHREFVRTIRESYARLLAGKLTVSMDLLRFLKSWLSGHILGTDQQYVPYLQSAKVPAARA